MTDSSGSGSRPLFAGLLLAALLALNLPFMYASMFSSFAPYDDEGYLLLTVRDFIRHGGMYTESLSPYGPFYFLYEYLRHAGGALPATHDLTRIFTMVEWGAAVLLVSWFVFQLTESAMLAGVACVLAVPTASALANEPGHPQGMLLVLIAVSLLVAVRSSEDGRRWPWFVLGASIAAIVLTKVNSGVFVGLAFAVCLLPRMRQGRWRSLAIAAAFTAACVLPLVLMRSSLASWALPYCIASTAAIGGLVVAMRTGESASRIDGRQIRLMFAGAAINCIAALGFLASRGTSFGDLLTGWTLVPARLVSAFQLRAPVGWSSIPAAVLSIGLATLYRRNGDLRAWQLLKVLFGTAAVVTVLLAPAAVASTALRLSLLGPFLWLIVIPGAGPRWTSAQAFTRVLVGCVAALQMLVAYPIAGSQLQMASFFILPVALVCLSDAVGALGNGVPRLRIALLVALPLLLAWISVDRSVQAMADYREKTPLNLPGARRIHLDHERAADYQWIVANLRAHADRFVSLPGMSSLNLWTGIDPPTRFNAPSWMTLLGDDQQRTIAARLLASPRACAVTTEYRFWTGHEDISRKPLVAVLAHDFVPSGLGVDGFEILTLRSRTNLTNYLLAGQHEFRGDADRMAAPARLAESGGPTTIEVSFRTKEGGMLLSSLDRTRGTPLRRGIVMYVGTDGRLYAGSGSSMLVSAGRVSDGAWHRAVFSSGGTSQSLTIDSNEAVSIIGHTAPSRPGLHWILGSGYSFSLSSTTPGWFPFRGTMGPVILR